MIVRNYPITTDNVRNVGGKDMILTRMVNHYSALSKAKPVVDTTAPHPGVKKTQHEIKGDLFRKEKFHNVREAYKKVSTVKHYVDDKKPFTYDMKPKNCFKSAKEKYEEIEHLRTLKAMQKRVLSIGKMHERKKNRFDPIANPTYFFFNALKHDPKSEATKLITLKNLNEKLRQMNEKEKNRLLLGNTIYEAVENVDVDNWVQKCNKNIKRPKSAAQKNNEYIDNIDNIKNKKKNTNAILMEYNPGKFMKIHQFNRDNEGDKIIKRRQKKKEEEEKNKNRISNNTSKTKSMTLKSKINNGLLTDKIPIYNDNNPNGEDDSLDKFNSDVRQFIIENNVYRDEDFDVLIEELVKRNKNNKNVTRTAIEKIVLDIKDDLEN